MIENDNEEKFLLPSAIDVNNDELLYIHVKQQELDHLAFHDDRLNNNKIVIKKQKITNLNVCDSNQGLSFIFHTAFCGSTFLSKLLGSTEYFFSIREPNILMELANLKRVNEKFKNNNILFQSLINNTVRSFQYPKKRKLLFKPTNASNNIINELLLISDEFKALFLYIDLEDFLISILKKGEPGRSYIRNLYNILSLDSSPFILQDFRQVNTLTDLQIACLVWSMQMYEYQKFYYKKENVAFLHADKLLAEPKMAMKKISTFFGLELKDSDINKLKEKGLFTSHSKHKGLNYSAEMRKEEKDLIAKKYADDLKSTMIWLNKSIQLPLKPPSEKLLFM